MSALFQGRKEPPPLEPETFTRLTRSRDSLMESDSVVEPTNRVDVNLGSCSTMLL